jgi:alkylated DNA repair dioxygenase AlkB
MSQAQFDFDKNDADHPVTPAGLSYLSDYVSPAEENELLVRVESHDWSKELARRVQHYGWRYDYRARRVTPDAYLGPLPPWLERLADRLMSDDIMDYPDQVIVNEYLPGQGIAPHTDCEPCFGPVVAMLSLGSPVQMDFTHPDHSAVPFHVGQRSLLVLRGDARYSWAHGIAKRRQDRHYRIARRRRVSLTFRTVNPDRKEPVSAAPRIGDTPDS